MMMTGVGFRGQIDPSPDRRRGEDDEPRRKGADRFRLLTACIGFLPLVLSSALPAAAVADDRAGRVISRWVEAIGGARALRQIESVYTISSVEAAGLTGTLEEWTVQDGRRRTDLDLGVFKSLTVFGKKSCWNIGPNGKRTESSGDDLKAEVSSSYTSSLSHLLPGRLPGTARYVGTGEAGEVEIIEFLPAGGEVLRIRVDRATGLPLSSESPDGAHAMTVRYDDWRPVGGVLVSHRITQWTGKGTLYATTTLEVMKVNGPIDDSLFEMPGESTAGLSFAAGRSSLSIPFRLSGNHILLDVHVNGSGPVTFVLDTGAQISVIDAEWADELGLELKGQVEGMGAGEDAIQLSLAQVGSVKVQGVELTNQLFATLPLKPFYLLSGERWYGILGFNFISRFAMEIDFQSRLLHLYSPEEYTYQGDGDQIPIVMEHQHPMLIASLEWGDHDSEDYRRFEGRFLIDTGHGGQLSINRKFIESNDILSMIDETLEAPLGFGAGGETRGVLGRIPLLRLGRYEVGNPVAGFSTDLGGALGTFTFAGVIGTEILRQFTVIFDYNNSRMILEPNDEFGNPFEQDMLGALLVIDEEVSDRLRVHSVLENSPASQAGLRPGDRISGIDGRAVSAGDIQKIRETAKGAGIGIEFTVERDGKTFDVTVTTRRMI